MKDCTADLLQPMFRQSFGAGPRQGLAVHCSLAHSGTWRGVATALEDAVTLTAFDMLTHGRSPDWDGQGNYQDRNVQAGLSLMTQPIDLMGHSFGATVALQMAVQRPDLVRSLTLIEPVFFAAIDSPDMLQTLAKQNRPFVDALAAGHTELAARLFNRLWSSGAPKWPDLPARTRAAMVRAIEILPACDTALYTDRAGLLRPGGLDSLTMPVLLLHGDETHPTIQVINAALQRHLPYARTAVIHKAGHMVPITHPEQVAAHIQNLWTS